jgi:hypothetical protein
MVPVRADGCDNDRINRPRLLNRVESEMLTFE